MTMIYYGIRGRLAEHRDYGHAFVPWVRGRLDARNARRVGQ